MNKYIQCKCTELGSVEISLTGLRKRIDVSMKNQRFFSVLQTIESPRQMSLKQCRVCKTYYQASVCGQGMSLLTYIYEVPPVDKNEWKKKPFPNPFAEIVDSEEARKCGF